MKRTGFALIWMVLLSVGGSLINYYLINLHTSQSSVPRWFVDVCSPESDPAYDCHAVLKTKWAVFPPYEQDPDTGEQPGIPVALLGWFYFSTVLVWCVLVGRCDYARRLWHHLLLFGVVAGCLASVFYLYILFTQLEVKCLWCMVSHALNFGLLVGVILLRPRRPALVALDGEATEKIDLPPVCSYPSMRLILAAIVCMAVLMFAEYHLYLSDQHKTQRDQYHRLASGCRLRLNRLHEDLDTQLALYRGQTPVEIHLRRDDPTLGSHDSTHSMIIFADFHCSACRWFARDLKSRIIPTFGDLLRVTWKHMPMCAECNPYIEHSGHAQCCESAYAAEAARLQGGNDAFWKAHDALFDAFQELKKLDYRRFAVSLGFDPDRFLADMQSDAVKERVLEDVELGRSLGVSATPTVFLDGRKVERFMLADKAFIEMIKQ